MENKSQDIQRPLIHAKDFRDPELNRKLEKALLRKTFEVSTLMACQATKRLAGFTEINGKIKIASLEYGDDNRIIQAIFLHDGQSYRINGDRFVTIPTVRAVITKVKNDFYGRQ